MKKPTQVVIIEKEKGETLKILGQIYSWMGVGIAIYLMCLPEWDNTNFFLAVKMLILLAFMYRKNNWRMLTLILCAISIIYSLINLYSILNVIDLVGFSIIFWYALKYRK